MPKNYTQLIENVKKRSNPDFINESTLFQKSFNDELGKLHSSGLQILEYIKRAMQGVESRYTERTIEAGDKVKAHLIRNNSTLDYKYQGSVMSNTHIKGYSDIDLIQITNSFYSHESIDRFNNRFNSDFSLSSAQRQKLLNVISGTPYAGSVNADLRTVRNDAEIVLVSNYKYVDITKPKSIEVNPTNPDRLVDVVTASWYRTVESEINNDDDLKGIQIYDKDKNERLPVDYPFLKIRLLNERNNDVNGRLKKMIRFLKTLKADSEQDLKKFSSFDICSVCYNIPTYNYSSSAYYELVFVLYQEFKKILENESYRNSIVSIDGTEYIFKNKPEKVKLLALLFAELESVYKDLLPKTSVLRFL